MNKVWGLHLILISIFLAATTYTFLGVGNMSVVCSKKEQLALLKFKHNVKDDYEMLSSWVGNDCCRWERIQCDVVTGEVESLNLRGNKAYSYDDQGYQYLVGNEVNSSLAELRRLKYLDLSANSFGGSRIPEFIGSLKHLRYLNLSDAGFSGLVTPHIGNLSNLKVLDLCSNYRLMTDDVAWTFRLLSLEHLDLSAFDLSRTKNWDMLLYMIPSLKELCLSSCQLSNADVRPFLNSSKILPNIKHLDLSKNYFKGPLPGFFQNMTSLACELDKTFLSSFHHNFSALSKIQHLDLSFNSIQGMFPSVLTNMSSLRVLDLSRNTLNSSVPLIPNLLELDLSFNEFKQIEHVGIWRQCHLKVLSASNNHFNILDLHESLYGAIPEAFGRLSNLIDIDLSHSRLTSPIPESLGRLRFLEVLDLSYNQIKGLIPTFLGKLHKLDLSFNQLNGSIPESIGKLATLTDLDLEFNWLTGSIPTSLGRLGSLRKFLVGSNLLNGTIPVSIGELSKLHSLDIANNSLQGVLSEAHFSNLAVLKELYASSNKLKFIVSREWVPPFQLESLELSSCNIGSGFPQWLQNQRKLELLMNISFLDLSHNKLSGPLTNLPSGGISRVLFLEDNLFSESIPRSLCRRTNLQFLDLSKNRLTGRIPKCLENLKTLATMIFSSNQLSGVIPSSVALTSLCRLNLNDNNFTGELPLELGNLRCLNVLDLGDNRFTGNIPKWIGENLTSLMVLRLRRNNFTGRIPESLCISSNLRILDVSHNNLTGTIPRCLGELSAMVEINPLPWYSGSIDYDENVIQAMKGADLEYTTNWELVYNMDLSSNKLVGEIPLELTALCTLMGLNLSNNHLRGSIPGNIGNMKNLESLDFSNNELIGMIPSSMAGLNFLSHLNLSHNNFSGRVPTGSQLQTLIDPSIYDGNKDLCGPPLPKSCSNHQGPTTVEPTKIHQYKCMEQWRRKLFMFVEKTIDLIHVEVVVRVAKLKRGRMDA
uniref:Leucine-rich repeat-containing N-terminal plant-type domain-containing protein n=1 Tax=Lactuca sativa TaxID=4236 RepID=A0A9R1XKP9_LACSA|nr:hypothetical protein LSAT_V11C300107960 [Lactuca sativa]